MGFVLTRRVGGIVRSLGVVLATLALAGAPAWAASTYWQGPVDATGDWFDPANWTNGVPLPDFAPYAYINAGTAQVAGGDAATSSISIGHAADAQGGLLQTGGTLSSSPYLYVGYSGQGRYEMTGGLATFKSLYLAHQGDSTDYSTGELLLSGGEIAVNGTMGLGGNGVGTVQHTGGILRAEILRWGTRVGSSKTYGGGTYNLDGTGELITGATLIGGWGRGDLILRPGLFRQTGGLHRADEVYISFKGTTGSWDQFNGTYELAGGRLEAGDLHVGYRSHYVPGQLVQTGGDVAAKALDVSEDSVYSYTGGSLTVTERFRLWAPSAVFDCGDQPVTLDAPSGLVDLSVGELRGLSQASVHLGPQALLQHDSDDLSALIGGGVTGEGIVHRRGDALAIPAGRTILGSGLLVGDVQNDGLIQTGTLRDLHVVGSVRGTGTWRVAEGRELKVYDVDLAGRMEAGEGASIVVQGDFTLRPGAYADLGAGRIGEESSGSRTLTVQGGELWAGSAGNITAASQTGGSVAFTGQLHLNDSATYALTDGSLSAGSMAGGTLHVQGGSARVGTLSSRLELSGGQLASDTVSSASVVHNAGTHEVGSLQLGTGKAYQYFGGQLRVTEGLHVAGTLDCGGQAVTVEAPSGLIDFREYADGSVVNASAARFHAGPQTLVLMPEGFDGGSVFGGGFNVEGLVHFAGGPLSIPADRSVVGMTDNYYVYQGQIRTNGIGPITDFVDCQGSLQAAPGRKIDLLGGLRVGPAGQADLGAATLAVEGDNWSTQGGSLSAYAMDIGKNATGRFVQADGTVALTSPSSSTTSLTVGAVDGQSARYELQAGRLETIYTKIGAPNRHGTFEQTGGVHEALRVYVGHGSHWTGNGGGTGEYILAGGRLEAQSLLVGPVTGPTPASFRILSADAELVLQSLFVSEGGRLEAVPGTQIHLNAFRAYAPPASLADLAGVALVFDQPWHLVTAYPPSPEATLYPYAPDLGPEGFDGQTLGTLQVGGEATEIELMLEAQLIRSAWPKTGALYVDTLILNRGSAIDLGTVNLYCRNLVDLGGTFSASGGGQLVVVPEPTGLALLLLALPGLRRRR